MSILLELNLPTAQLEEGLDTLAALPFAIDPTIRPSSLSSRRVNVEFTVANSDHIAQIENALLGRGLLQAQLHVCEGAFA